MIFNVGAGGATDADKIKYGDSNVGATLDNLNESVDGLNESVGELNERLENIDVFPSNYKLLASGTTNNTSNVVTTSDNLNNYKYLLFGFKSISTSVHHMPTVIPTSFFKQNTAGFQMALYGDNSSRTIHVNYVTDTSVKIHSSAYAAYTAVLYGFN